MKRIHAVLLILGGSWLAVVLWLVLSNVIPRETHLGIIALILDKLPAAVGVPLLFCSGQFSYSARQSWSGSG
jgi:hypothetical protein